MTALNKERSQGSISAVFKFSQTGNLRAIYLNAESDHDQLILQKGLAHLLKPGCLDIVKKLFGVGRDGT